VRAPAILLSLATALLISSCGGERSFDAEEAVAELNTAGASLALGDPLTSSETVGEVTTVTFTGGEGPIDGDAHGAGAIVILDDTETARAEFARCESAVSFVCFRAANAVLRFSQISPSEQTQISAALQALESEPE